MSTVLFSAEDRRLALREEALHGLTSTPKELPPKWFYDRRGSELFEAITRLPEYYLTRAERSILEPRAAEIAELTEATTLIELGSGTSDKTRLLLDALAPRRFVPFDVSEEMLRASAERLALRYPALEITALVGDFDLPLPPLPAGEPRLLAFLGSTIGNLMPTRRKLFLNDVASSLDEGDWFLLGADLVKTSARLEAAYDDAAGVTREFNLNVLRVLNHELDADFDLPAFEHVARWNAEAEWMEIFVRSTRQQTVRLEALELEVAFEAGELMRTEISAKFHLPRLVGELEAAGLATRCCWTDPAGDFALLLAMRPARFELATSASA
ncbi:MAG TPA: L-histidine N(alpha)-methyltransferase, partial [Gaiellaceae bacterium]|nr:L-histidine N(alpha)-methyltransferase [Gaiellaceae bacterium]